MLCILGYSSKVEEPEEVVYDDESAWGDERRGWQRDDGPCVGEILEVDDVAYYRKHGLEEWQGVEEV